MMPPQIFTSPYPHRLCQGCVHRHANLARAFWLNVAIILIALMPQHQQLCVMSHSVLVLVSMLVLSVRLAAQFVVVKHSTQAAFHFF